MKVAACPAFPGIYADGKVFLTSQMGVTFDCSSYNPSYIHQEGCDGKQDFIISRGIDDLDFLYRGMFCFAVTWSGCDIKPEEFRVASSRMKIGACAGVLCRMMGH